MKMLLCLFIPCACYAVTVKTQGNPQPLIVSVARAGSQPSSAIDASTTYSIRVKKNDTASISGALNSPLPDHSDLKVTFTAPPNAISFPSVSLTTTPQTLVSGVQKGSYSRLPITYEYLATVAAGIVPLSLKTLILTVTEN